MQGVSSERLDSGVDERVQRVLRHLGAAVLILFFALILDASPADASDTADSSDAPVLRLYSAGESSGLALMLESHLDLDISGLLARGTLIQRFRNDSADWVEAEYLLPLPPDAAVTQLDIDVGERRIHGQIREREEARKVYDAARRAGKRSALLEQQRPHLFTTRIANIPPGEEIRLRIELLIPVSYHSGEFTLRFPTTLTPAYIPGVPLSEFAMDKSVVEFLPLDGSAWALPTDQVPDAPLIVSGQHQRPGSDADPLNPFSLSVKLAPGIPLAEVSALYHDLTIERSGPEYLLSLRDDVAEMDRDLVLRWVGRDSSRPQAAVFRERLGEEDYALLMLLPPVAAKPEAQLPRELLLLVDISGSMQGESIRQARSAVLHALSTLSSTDYVNVIAFNDRVQSLFSQARVADAVTLASAKRFVTALQADRGTQMLPALAASLRMPRPPHSSSDAPLLRQIVFVTDGAVGNEEALFDLLAAERGQSRLFTVGIGSAPNSYFMQRAADLGRGEAVFIARPQEVAPRLNALFDRVRRPLAQDLQVHWPMAVEAFPEQVPDLYAGQPLMQVARLGAVIHDAIGDATRDATRDTTGDTAGDDTQVVRVSGRLAGRSWEREIVLPSRHDDAGVATHWARRKLAAVLQGRQRGVSQQQIRDEALPLALRFSIASPFTSFVAVEEQTVRPEQAPLGAESLLNAQPHGQQAAQHFVFAQGATTGLAKLYLGLLLIFIALFVYAMTRPEPG